MRHRARRARYFYARGTEALARFVDIGHPDREVAKCTTQGIWLGLLPIMGQLDYGVTGLVAIPDKGVPLG